jgi:hypothetical protein
VKGEDKFLGFVDSLDIVFYLAYTSSFKKEFQGFSLDVPVGKLLKDQDIPDLLREKKLFVFEPESMISEVMEVLCKPQEPFSRVYRAVLLREFGDFQKKLPGYYSNGSIILFVEQDT